VFDVVDDMVRSAQTQRNGSPGRSTRSLSSSLADISLVSVMLHTLPVELLDYLFRYHHPASRTSDDSVLALARCAALSVALRAVVVQPSIWEPHYKARYTSYDPTVEPDRRAKWGDDWFRLYTLRRSFDRRALAILADLENYRGGLDRRDDCAHEVVSMYSSVLLSDRHRPRALIVFA
jgi:hypothetical protein